MLFPCGSTKEGSECQRKWSLLERWLEEEALQMCRLYGMLLFEKFPVFWYGSIFCESSKFKLFISCKNTYFYVIFIYYIWHWIYLLLQVFVYTDMLQVFIKDWNCKRKKLDDCYYLLYFKTMYKERSLEFLIDESDTVHNYEQRGRDKTASSQYEKGMQALSSMNRVQQVEVLHGN